MSTLRTMRLSRFLKFNHKIASNFLFCFKYFSSLPMKIEKMASIINCGNEEAERLASEHIKNGDVIAVPTDTVYGLACNANSIEAVKKLYEIKGRDEAKPIAICVGNLEEFRKWGYAEHLPEELLKDLLPGPVTLVLEQTPLLNNPHLNPHTSKIGIRIPDYKFIRNMASYAGIPIALTSANPSSVPSSLSVAEFESLHPKLAAVFDGGTLGGGEKETRIGSTVVDLSSEGFYSIVRNGIACKEITELLKLYSIFPK